MPLLHALPCRASLDVLAPCVRYAGYCHPDKGLVHLNYRDRFRPFGLRTGHQHLQVSEGQMQAELNTAAKAQQPQTGVAQITQLPESSIQITFDAAAFPYESARTATRTLHLLKTDPLGLTLPLLEINRP